MGWIRPVSLIFLLPAGALLLLAGGAAAYAHGGWEWR